MAYRMNRENLAVNKVIFEGCQEQPVDLDFSLPDYCPDIQKILKCQIYPQINSKNISGDRLDVDGTAVIRLLYVDAANSKVRFCEYSSPFAASFSLNATPEDAIAIVKTKVEYLNCRAVSSRRLDIHGVFSLCAKVCEKSQQEILCDIAGDDIQEKILKVPANNVIGVAGQQFSISEVLEISQGKPAAQGIVRTDAIALLSDYKTISNKLILKGEVILKILYLSDIEESALETMEFSLPISQILDVAGIEDNCICDVHLDVLSADVQIRSDSAQEDRLFGVDVKLSATAIAYTESEVSLICDVYSTKYELESAYKQIELCRLVECVSDTCITKNVISTPERAISKVIDVWNELANVSAKKEGDHLLFIGKMNICILALNGENEPFYIEKMLDFEYEYSWIDKPENIFCEPTIYFSNISYRIMGANEIEIKTEISLCAAVYTSKSYRTIAEVSANEDQPKQKDENSALTIYYAEKGENLWDIARKYCTSVDVIKLENELSEDTLEHGGMLLIPM